MNRSTETGRPGPRPAALRPPQLLIPALLGVLAILAACSPNPPPVLSEAAQKVLVETSPEAVLPCKSLGMIVGRAASLMGNVPSEQETDARNRAASMRGNRILARQSSLVTEPLTRQYEVFLCPAPSAAGGKG